MTQSYEIYTSPIGFSSIRQLSSGEIIHPHGNPYAEALLLYAEQSRIAHLLQIPSPHTLQVWDVGLGAGCNAYAVLHTALDLQNRGQLKRSFSLTSFEIDLEPFRLVVSRPDLFSYADHNASAEILKTGSYTTNSDAGVAVTWNLKHGDYRQLLKEAPHPHIIFYDPFSYKSEDAPLWSKEAFELLKSKLSSSPYESTLIYTYSRATRVRALLLSCGYFVASGVATGAKSETTVAVHFNGTVTADRLSRLATETQLKFLGTDWLGRWSRSHIKAGPGGQELDASIQGHLQFSLPLS